MIFFGAYDPVSPYLHLDADQLVKGAVQLLPMSLQRGWHARRQVSNLASLDFAGHWSTGCLFLFPVRDPP